MELPAQVKCFEELSGLSRELHLAIGVFDGVHLGHKAVIESAVFSAHRSNGVCGVLTFDPHPSRLFRPEDPTRLMMEIDTKTQMLHAVGVDVVIRKHFDRAYASIAAESFLGTLKESLPTLKSVYVGENFRFGQKRVGTIETLIECGRQLDLSVFSIDRIKHNGEPISSTRIRKQLRTGGITAANDLLGYNYFSRGLIVDGAKLGRKMGFPTLNLPWVPECLPAFGVYLVQFRAVGMSDWAFGVANYGVRPTVSDGADSPTLEIHALSETSLSTGDHLEAEWLKFIRPEMKFASVEALKDQIAKDRVSAIKLAHNG